MPRATALQVYKNLPKKDCGKCGAKTCISYAIKLADRQKTLEDCPALSAEQKKKLTELLTPAVRTVSIGNGRAAIKVGGEEVMYRHELRFYNQTALFIEVNDLMHEKEADDRIRFVKNFRTERLGRMLRLDGIGIRSLSGDAKKYPDLVKKICNAFDGPLILCADDPNAVNAGLGIAKKRRPLLYAASRENLNDLLAIAKEYDSPLVLRSADLDELGLMSKKASADGVEAVLDPAAGYCEGLVESLSRYAMIRMAAVTGSKEYGHPLMASTLPLWEAGGCTEVSSCAYNESSFASMLIDRFASIILMHSKEPWAILPVLTLRDGLFSDPRVEPTAEPKLYSAGGAGKDSPVLLTTNFALTYHSVSKDLEDAKIPAHLLVVDTEGLAVSVAVAADRLTPELVKGSLDKNRVAEKVSHRTLVIPGVAGQLKDAVEDLTGWTVVVGPQDSSQLAVFLKDHGKKGSKP